MAKATKPAPKSLYRSRKSFAKIPDVMDVPNLIAVQMDSFEWFKTAGLAEAFNDICPIVSSNGLLRLVYMSHHFDEAPSTVDECKRRDMTY
ncbi:MAG: hypothetical protein IJG53_07890, partial [Eggerthellaceae bacterium]|nr:hypothetical protein [Eggerthellaceae bacterium]